MAAGGGMPPLQLSSGPAISEAPGGQSTGVTGDFFFKRDPAWLDALKSAMPLVLAGGVLWLAMRR